MITAAYIDNEHNDNLWAFKDDDIEIAQVVLPSSITTPAAAVAYYDERLEVELAGNIPPSEPAETPPQLIASALRIVVADGDVSEVNGVFQLVAALYLGVGRFELWFVAPQPDNQYFEVIGGGAPSMIVTERTADYLTVEARDGLGGALVDPPEFSIQVFR